MSPELIEILQGVFFSATPLVIAGLGETLTERSGVVNLSLDGSIVFSAMTGFVSALLSGSVILGIAISMICGASIALLIAYCSLKLEVDQIKVGFILTIIMAELATFLGRDYTRLPGERVRGLNIPILSEIPVIGEIFFQQNVLVYISFVLIFAVWFWLYRTRHGLELRSVGETPETAFARGIDIYRLRYIYTVVGGALVGLAGATYSLSVKTGWANPPPMLGDGWIALAIVIFGGWHPFRVAMGAYLFAVLRVFVTIVQRDPNFPIPFVLLNTLPWLLMLTTLVLVGMRARKNSRTWARAFLSSNPPASLGKHFTREH